VVAGRAGAAAVTGSAGFACFGFGFGLGAAISMGGSCVLPDGAAVGAGPVGVGVSRAAGSGDAGAAAAGASLSGAGAVCAKAPAQSEEIRKDVEASNRERNDTEAPC
jgi:hypothetical protein